MRLALQPQRSTATSLDEVLAKLNLTAHEDTKSNDLIQGYDFAANLRTDVVLVDRNKTHYIILQSNPERRQPRCRAPAWLFRHSPGTTNPILARPARDPLRPAATSSCGTAVKHPTLVAGVAGVRLPLLPPDAAEFG